MKLARRPRRPLRLDLSPLIDCVFQLLIFFMLSSSLISPAIDLDLPNAESGEPSAAPELLVTVDAAGTLYLNGDTVSREDFGTRLAPLIEQSVDKVVTFQGDESMDYSHFVFVLDQSHRHGAAHVDVAHDALDER